MALFHYKISKHFSPKKIAVLSAFFILTCADIYTYGLAYGTEIDIFYSLIVYLQAISMFWFYRKQQYLKLFLFSYFFSAIGFLTKGFPSPVFQLLTLSALCVYARSVKILFKWQLIAGILVFVLIAGSYFFLYSKYSSPTRYLFNLLQEAMLKSGVGERSNKLFDKAVLYPWLFFKMFLPWSLLLLLLFKKVRYAFRQNPLVWFSILFMLFNLWVYWFTGQPKIRYVYMFVPFDCTVLIHVYWQFTESYPAIINRILKYIGTIFILIFLGLIALPFFVEVSITWTIVVASVFFILIIICYRLPGIRIWNFIAGFILLRLMYAALFIPMQRKSIESYGDHTLKIARNINNGPLLYWADPLTISIGVNTSLLSYQNEFIKLPQNLPLEIPYYYYRYTGHIISYDTLPQNFSTFISYAGQIGNKRVDTLYAYDDRNTGQRVVVYKMKNMPD